MEELVEIYISKAVATEADQVAAKKAFKTELSNGPVKKTVFKGGITGQKAFGNFDLQLFHSAYDADLEAAGLLNLFDNNGLLKSKGCYGTIKNSNCKDADAIKYLKTLWVLQFGSSDYTLTNLPAAAKPLSPEELWKQLAGDDMMNQIFNYSVADLVFAGTSVKKNNTCKDVYIDWFETPEKLNKFLIASYLKDKPYEIVKKNICSMFLCMIAAEQVLQKARATNRHFADSIKDDYELIRVEVEYDTLTKVPVRIYFFFHQQVPAGITNSIFIRYSLRFKLTEEDKLLDMPTYTSAARGFYATAGKFKDMPEMKFSEINFAAFDNILKQYL